MSSDHSSLAPMIVIKDRYGGVYSGGRWLAVASADVEIEGRPRSIWVTEEGPSDGDISCALFWMEPPEWIAIGQTPEGAASALVSQAYAADNDWTVVAYRDRERDASPDI
jgi:hypothetical protein